jgi:hypothetical protein
MTTTSFQSTSSSSAKSHRQRGFDALSDFRLLGNKRDHALGEIRMKAFGLKSAPATGFTTSRRGLGGGLEVEPRTRPPPQANFRRTAAVNETGKIRISSGASFRRADFGGALDSGANAQVGGAAAQVSGHGAVNVLLAWRRVVFEQRRGSHDLPGLTAVAALGHVQFAPRLLQGMRCPVRCEALDRGDRRIAPTVPTRAPWQGAHGGAVAVHGAGAALGDAAAELGANQIEVVAQHPEERVSGAASTARG